MNIKIVLLPLVLATFAISCTKPVEEVNVYSGRHYASDEALFAQFTEETGIKVNLIKADSDQLLGRLEIEGEKSPADLFITPDVSRLSRASSLGLLARLPEYDWLMNVPLMYRDKNGFWTGLTMRARVVVYAPERIDSSLISSYEDLAGDKLKGRLIMRSIQSQYNQSLLASIIVHDGEAAAGNWVSDLVSNFAREPQGNDRDQMKAIASGIADVSVVNTYYLGQMLHSANEEERRVAASLSLLFPNQHDRGTHVNVSGAGVLRNAPNSKNALRLLEFLLSKSSQEYLSNSNFEYPVNPDAQMAELLRQWGVFRADTIDLNQLNARLDQALMIARTGGWK